MTRALNAIDALAGAIGAAVVVGFTLVMIADVISRYILSLPLPWAPEFSILLFQISCFVGAAIALRRGLHFGLGLVLPFNDPRIRRAIAVFVALVVFGCSLYMIRYGWRLSVMTRASSYPTLPFSHNVIYIALMAGAGLTALFALEQAARAVLSPSSDAPHEAAARAEDQ